MHEFPECQEFEGFEGTDSLIALCVLQKDWKFYIFSSLLMPCVFGCTK